MLITRQARSDDLDQLLVLYRHLNPNIPQLSEQRRREIWRETLANENLSLMVGVVADRPIATCLLITAPNLMRGGAPHAFLENVVTHPDVRRCGYGRATVRAALDDAWRRGCFQVFLMTGRGRANPFVLTFYESCGFEQGGKTGFVAPRPVG
ncbi:MAG: GNAT family N-acetyltransferase [Rhizobiales bacterium]|nr:GNAT family N-acetyltransferase [Hyphomicrobiales bacterium]